MAFNADRSLQAAFFNRGLGAQSYHPNSDAVLPVVRRNMKLTKDGFAPDACFIDVLSSEPLYDYYGADGRFFDRLHTRDVWRQGFAYIRDYLGGEPQISEAGADQYIGWLDAGARAHMRAEGGAGTHQRVAHRDKRLGASRSDGRTGPAAMQDFAFDGTNLHRQLSGGTTGARCG
jgi:hypothetical protein